MTLSTAVLAWTRPRSTAIPTLVFFVWQREACAFSSPDVKRSSPRLFSASFCTGVTPFRLLRPLSLSVSAHRDGQVQGASRAVNHLPRPQGWGHCQKPPASPLTSAQCGGGSGVR